MKEFYIHCLLGVLSLKVCEGLLSLWLTQTFATQRVCLRWHDECHPRGPASLPEQHSQGARTARQCLHLEECISAVADHVLSYPKAKPTKKKKLELVFKTWMAAYLALSEHYIQQLGIHLSNSSKKKIFRSFSWPLEVFSPLLLICIT